MTIAHKTGRRRTLLGRLELCDLLEGEIARSGMLDLTFSQPSDACVVSDDGNTSVAWLAPSGTVAGLLVQDYVTGESRSIPFSFGTLEIETDGVTIVVYLVANLADELVAR